MRSQFGKDYDETYNVINVGELKAKADAWGERSHSPEWVETCNIRWEFVWYGANAFSVPHYHPKSESNYYIHFPDDSKNRDYTAYIGWPISEAKVINITESHLFTFPAHLVHTFSNQGDPGVLLLHAFSPPWVRDMNQTVEVYDMMTQTYYDDGEKYGEFVNGLYEKYKNFGELCEEFKKMGIY